RIMQTSKVTLDQAGWYVWLLGLGNTERVRRFLLAELNARRELAQALVGTGSRRRTADQAVERASRSPAFAELRAHLTPGQMSRMVGGLNLARGGVVSPELRQLSANDAEDWRDAMAQSAWPVFRDALKPLVELPATPPGEALPAKHEMSQLLAVGLDPAP